MEDHKIRFVNGDGGISTLKAAVDGRGRKSRLWHLLNELGWRRETRLEIDGEDKGLAAENFYMKVLDQRTANGYDTIILKADLAQLDVPLNTRSRRLKETSEGWMIGKHRLNIIQPPGENIFR